MSGLREALGSLRSDLDRSYPDRAQYDIPSTVIDRLDAILAVESVEPADVTEARAAIRRVLGGKYYGGVGMKADYDDEVTGLLMDALLAAGVIRDEATVKAEAVEEFVATAGIWPDSMTVTIGTVREQGAKHVASLRGGESS